MCTKGTTDHGDPSLIMAFPKYTYPWVTGEHLNSKQYDHIHSNDVSFQTLIYKVSQFPYTNFSLLSQIIKWLFGIYSRKQFMFPEFSKMKLFSKTECSQSLWSNFFKKVLGNLKELS